MSSPMIWKWYWEYWKSRWWISENPLNARSDSAAVWNLRQRTDLGWLLRLRWLGFGALHPRRSNVSSFACSSQASISSPRFLWTASAKSSLISVVEPSSSFAALCLTSAEVRRRWVLAAGCPVQKPEDHGISLSCGAPSPPPQTCNWSFSVRLFWRSSLWRASSFFPSLFPVAKTLRRQCNVWAWLNYSDCLRTRTFPSCVRTDTCLHTLCCLRQHHFSLWAEDLWPEIMKTKVSLLLSTSHTFIPA